jgi:hypothetical protein
MDRDFVQIAIPWLALVVSAIALAFAGWAALHTRGYERRDNELQGRIVELEEERETRSGPRRRAAVATALLTELDALDMILGQVAEYRDSSPLLKYLPRLDMLDRVTDYVDLLSSESVRSLLALKAEISVGRVNLQAMDGDRARRERDAPSEAVQLKVLNQHDSSLKGPRGSWAGEPTRRARY